MCEMEAQLERMVPSNWEGAVVEGSERKEIVAYRYTCLDTIDGQLA